MEGLPEREMRKQEQIKSKVAEGLLKKEKEMRREEQINKEEVEESLVKEQLMKIKEKRGREEAEMRLAEKRGQREGREELLGEVIRSLQGLVKYFLCEEVV